MANDEFLHPERGAGLTISPALDLAAEAAQVPDEAPAIDRRVLWLCGISIVIGLVAALVAQALMALIALVTNLSFFGRISLEKVSPALNQLGGWVVAVPVV